MCPPGAGTVPKCGLKLSLWADTGMDKPCQKVGLPLLPEMRNPAFDAIPLFGLFLEWAGLGEGRLMGFPCLCRGALQPNSQYKWREREGGRGRGRGTGKGGERERGRRKGGRREGEREREGERGREGERERVGGVRREKHTVK